MNGRQSFYGIIILPLKDDLFSSDALTHWVLVWWIKKKKESHAVLTIQVKDSWERKNWSSLLLNAWSKDLSVLRLLHIYHLKTSNEALLSKAAQMFLTLGECVCVLLHLCSALRSSCGPSNVFQGTELSTWNIVIHRSALTLQPLKGEVNHIDYLRTVAPVKVY